MSVQNVLGVSVNFCSSTCSFIHPLILSIHTFIDLFYVSKWMTLAQCIFDKAATDFAAQFCDWGMERFTTRGAADMEKPLCLSNQSKDIMISLYHAYRTSSRMTGDLLVGEFFVKFFITYLINRFSGAMNKTEIS